MKQLSFGQAKELATLKADVDTLSEKLQETVKAFNEKMAEEWRKVEAARDALNNKVGETEGFRNDIVSQMEDYFNDRTEKWQESDAGQEYSAWMQGWENACLETVEIEQPQEIEFDGDWDFDIDDLTEKPE